MLTPATPEEIEAADLGARLVALLAAADRAGVRLELRHEVGRTKWWPALPHGRHGETKAVAAQLEAMAWGEPANGVPAAVEEAGTVAT